MEQEKINVLRVCTRQNVSYSSESRRWFFIKWGGQKLDETLHHFISLADLRDEIVISLFNQVSYGPKSILHAKAHLFTVHECSYDVE